MWNRNRAYLQLKNYFMNCLRTYIAQNRICPGNKKPMKYDVVRINIQASKLQKVFIFLEMFLANYIAPKFLSKMMYVSLGTILLVEFQSFNKMTNQKSLGKGQKSIKSKIAWQKQFFCLRRDFCLRLFFLDKQIFRQKIQKWKICIIKKK